MDLHPGAGAGDSPALCPLGQGSARSRWRSRAFHSHRAPSRWPGADTRLPRRRSPGTGAEAPGLRHPERDPAHGACAHADSQGPVRAVTPAANRSRQRRRAPAPPRLAPPLGAGPAPRRWPRPRAISGLRGLRAPAACALPEPRSEARDPARARAGACSSRRERSAGCGGGRKVAAGRAVCCRRRKEGTLPQAEVVVAELPGIYSLLTKLQCGSTEN